MIVYVTTQGSKIVKEGRHLLVKKDGATHHTLFTYKLEQLVICGRIELTASARSFLLKEQIDTVFLRLDGRYVGRFATVEPKNVFLRQKQFQMVADQKFCLCLAQQIVRGKLLNMQTILQRIRRTRKQRKIDPCLAQLKNCLHKLPEAENTAALMGLEGSATSAYFTGFRMGLDNDFGFSRRVRRPPTDPVNSVLSLLYTLLINRVYAAVRMAGLDPYPGVLHRLDYGRHALPLDLVEEFRTILADSLTLSLFNLKSLKQGDFQIDIKEDDNAGDDEKDTRSKPVVDILDEVVSDPLGRISNSDAEDMFDLPSQQVLTQPTDSSDLSKYPVRLTSAAFKRVLTAFEKKLQKEFFHPMAEKRMTYGESLVYQARLYRRVIAGELAEYHPLLLK